MKQLLFYKWLLITLFFISFNSCDRKEEVSATIEISRTRDKDAFKAVMQKHLDAVMTKDTIRLRSTMSPHGNMELIQPSSEILYSVDSFMQFHKDWFAVPDWTVSTKITSTTIGTQVGVATTEFLYEEPERNGKPYFNRLIVTYTLEKIDGIWCVIKDHASSVEKTKS
jgi:hypothetical protein